MKADTTEKGLESLIMRPNHEAPEEKGGVPSKFAECCRTSAHGIERGNER